MSEVERRRVPDTTNTFRFDGTLEEWSRKIAELISTHGDDAQLRTTVDSGYYEDDGCSCSSELELTTYRYETDVEVKRRLDREEKAKIAALRAKQKRKEKLLKEKEKKEREERELFLELAKKYGDLL